MGKQRGSSSVKATEDRWSGEHRARGQITDGRRQIADDRRQIADGRGQIADDRRQIAEDRGQQKPVISNQ
jgi:hypothetical protein